MIKVESHFHLRMHIFKYNYLLLLATSLFPVIGFSQNAKNNSKKALTTVVPLNNTATDDENSRSMGMLLLFKLNGNVVQRSLDQVSGDPFDLKLDTVDYKTVQSQLSNNNEAKHKDIVGLKPCKFIRIGLPQKSTEINSNEIKNSRYYYGYLFNEHRINTIEPLNTLILIETGYTNNRPTKIWIDYNNNFDFSDEEFYNWKYPAQNFRIPFPEKKSKSGIKVGKFPYYKFRQFSSMQDTAVQMLSNGREFVGSRECLKIVRENIICGEFVSQKDTVLVGIQDVNLNGNFQDLEIDRIVVGSSQEDEFSASLSQVISKQIQLVWMGNLYDVEIILAGSTSNSSLMELKLTPSNSKKNELSLLIDERIPRFRFEYLEKKKTSKNDKKTEHRNKRKSIRRIKAESKLIYVWSAENDWFIKDSAQLHNWTRLHPNTQLVMLNFGGSSKYLTSYNNRYSIHAIQGILTSKMVKKLKLQSMPQYFLLDKKNRIKFMGHSISQLNELNLN